MSAPPLHIVGARGRCAPATSPRPTSSAMLAYGAEERRALGGALAPRARSDDDYVRRASSLPGDWHLLVLSEDWCGDAVNTVPVVAKLAERCPNLDLRVLARDANLDIMDAHLTGRSRSIPVHHRARRGVRGARVVGTAAHRAAAMGLGAGTAAREDDALSRGAHLVRAGSRPHDARGGRVHARARGARRAPARPDGRTKGWQRRGAATPSSCGGDHRSRARTSLPEGIAYCSVDAVTRLASALAGVSITNTTRRFSSAPGWSPHAPWLTWRLSP